MPKIAILVLLLFAGMPLTAGADVYQYRDKDGNLRFTDDLSLVPPSQRARLKRSASIKSQPPKSTDPQPAAKLKTASRIKRSSRLKAREIKGVEDLQQQQQQLNAEFAALMQTKADLKKRGETITESDAMAQYNQEVAVLNERVTQYRQKQAAYNAAVEAYNKAIQ